ncbi:MAG TPA: hypothetical protein VF584_17380 [Longimicrobium sp.]|jgi:hypothetical protein
MRPRFLVAFCAVLLAACGDGTGTQPLDPVGTVRFDYRGAISGSYEAIGELPIENGAATQPATGATAVRRDSLLAVVAFRQSGGTRGDGFSLLLGALEKTGSYSIDALGCQTAPGTCRVGVFARDLDAAMLTTTPDTAAIVSNAYVLAFGSVNVTRLTDVRVRGTFSGVAVRLSDQNLQNPVTITNGEFDVPIPPQ